jgi:hypothetical protein
MSPLTLVGSWSLRVCPIHSICSLHHRKLLPAGVHGAFALSSQAVWAIRHDTALCSCAFGFEPAVIGAADVHVDRTRSVAAFSTSVRYFCVLAENTPVRGKISLHGRSTASFSAFPAKRNEGESVTSSRQIAEVAYTSNVTCLACGPSSA